MIDGDGSFFVSVTPKQISARFSIGQKKREIIDIINEKYFKGLGKVNGGDNIGARKATYFIICFYCNNYDFVRSFMSHNLVTRKRLSFNK